MADKDVLASWAESVFDAGRWTRTVFRKGSGPAVIIIHEIPGLHPQVVAYGEKVAAAGFTVFLPSLFGKPGKPISTGYGIAEILKNMCVRREFNVWANGRSSPIVDWLRALARKAHGECGGKGVGALGMCFTGGFALAMMTEPAVVAPVLSQPSLPLGKKGADKIDCSAAEIACAKRRFEEEDLHAIALAFNGDDFVPPQRLDMLEETFGKARMKVRRIDPSCGKQGTGRPPHSVLTVHLTNSGPTAEAEAETIAFFHQRLDA
ncbi:dienelactone hydrolase family protein [Caulobacter sp. SLTY]|uniref:dienelactone hydrolase family protein n=1 Tax=Caulobacter sp. SLTY TaxID=2683262 RepID=UPI0014130F5F|nr:dienelactone hydrolase family protein [Caulobacter sp. SLTY]NBB17337.1 dienelactone hydrolase family protein [Caulobacter sp. SLTY]